MAKNQIDARRFERAVAHGVTRRTPGGSRGRPTTISLNKATRSFLEKASAPAPVIAFYEKHCYAEPLAIGQLVFEAARKLRSWNSHEANAACIAAALLIVGSGLNGDPIVMDLKSPNLRIGFVSHDELWEEPESEPRDLLVDTGLNLGTFYLAAALCEDDFPVDGYEAAEIKPKQWTKFTSKL